MNSNRIELITGDFPPETGGISTYLYELASNVPVGSIRVVALPTPGWQTWDNDQQFSIARLRVPERLNSRARGFKLMAPAYLLHLYRVPQPSIVLCGHAHHSLTLSAWIYGATLNIPYGVIAHGADLLRAQGKAYQPVFNALMRRARVVFANSRQTANIASERVGMAPERLYILRPGVASRSSKITAEEVRVRHNITGRSCILTVGRLVERKGHDTVIAALPRVLDVIPDTRYLIVGTGPAKSTLEQLACDSGLDDKVIFAGYVPDEELGAYYQACDVFVMVSHEIPERGDIEGFGIVYLEANQFGKPVVGARTGGVADAVLHEKTGLLVEPENVQETADAIIRLLTDKRLSKRLGETGRERALRDFSSERSAQKVLEILRENGYWSS